MRLNLITALAGVAWAICLGYVIAACLGWVRP